MRIKFKRKVSVMGAHYESRVIPILGYKISIWVRNKMFGPNKELFYALYGQGNMTEYERNERGDYEFVGCTEEEAFNKAKRFAEVYVEHMKELNHWFKR